MTTARRLGAPDAKNRELLLDAAQELLLQGGPNGVSSRKVAERAGLKPQLVHYYFRTMDELFLAIFQRHADAGLARFDELVAGPRPLRALWEFSSNRESTAFALAFTGLANRSEVVRAEVVKYAERAREASARACATVMAKYGISSEQIPPVVVAFLVSSLGRVMFIEENLGHTKGHAEINEWVEQMITSIEP